jgi:hypothetical protein
MECYIASIGGVPEYIETDIISKMNGLPVCVLDQALDFYVFICGEASVRRLSVPKGFETDFGSIPRFVQNLVPPFSRGNRAYIIHDFLCLTGNPNRPDADVILRECLKFCGISWFQRWAIYYAVVAFRKFVPRQVPDTMEKNNLKLFEQLGIPVIR